MKSSISGLVHVAEGPAESLHSTTLPTLPLPAGDFRADPASWVSCPARVGFLPGTIGLTSKTTSPARTVRLVLSDPELSSFDLRLPTRSYGKRSRPDRHQVATTRVKLHALVVLASSHEPVKKKSLDFQPDRSILKAGTQRRRVNRPSVGQSKDCVRRC